MLHAPFSLKSPVFTLRQEPSPADSGEKGCFLRDAGAVQYVAVEVENDGSSSG